VRVVGDRFVFSSEVLFNVGAADLAPEGQAQIARVATILSEVSGDIPPGIDWILRVDGHTDNVPLSGTGEFRDNWELSQARALSVVRFLQDDLGFPPDRLAATGFGEHRPVAEGNSPESRAQNRRIELKLTER
jgi:chemotaxis protein MotB